MDIQISSRYRKNRGTLKSVSTRLERLAALMDAGTKVYVVFVDDPEMHGLNLRFKKKDKTTNVLSFPINQPDPEDGKLTIGEIIISVDTAVKEARYAGIPVDTRLEALFVHGLVHLLGYDHTRGKKQAVQMSQKEALLLKQLNTQNNTGIKKA
jgi:probable rRNA maturation factor